MRPSAAFRFLGPLLLAIALIAAACASDDDPAGDDGAAQDAGPTAVDVVDGDEPDDGDEATPDDQAGLVAYFAEFDALTSSLEARLFSLAASGAGAQSGSLSATSEAVAQFGDDLDDLSAPDSFSALHDDAVRSTAAFADALASATVSADGIAIRDAGAVDEFGRNLCALVAIAEQNGVPIEFACSGNDLPALLTQITQVVRELPDADDGSADDTDTGDPAFDTSAPPDLVAVGGNTRAAVGTGSYCWTSGDVGICGDSIGIITGDDPLVIRPGAAVSLVGMLDWRRVQVEGAQVSSAPAAPIDEGAGWLAWNRGDDARGIDVTVNSEGLHFTAPDTVGTYIVDFFLRVPQGDVTYGVLLEVVPSDLRPRVLC